MVAPVVVPAMGLRRLTAKNRVTTNGRSRMASPGNNLGRSTCKRIAPTGTKMATGRLKLCCSTSRRDM